MGGDGDSRGRQLWSQSTVCRCLLGVALDFPGGSDGKESVCSVEDLGLIPGLGRPLEKEMAIHSSILAWKIPCTEEPDGLQSIRLQRVEHDSMTKHILYKLLIKI